jgi:hypothetical protein
MTFPPIVDNTHIRIPGISGAKRARLFESLVKQHGLVCHWCKIPVVRQQSFEGRQANNTATLDHVLSRIEGGTDTRNNCVIACHGCNWERGKETGFWSGIAKFRQCAPNRLFGVMIRNGEAV